MNHSPSGWVKSTGMMVRGCGSGFPTHNPGSLVRISKRSFVTKPGEHRERGKINNTIHAVFVREEAWFVKALSKLLYKLGSPFFPGDGDLNPKPNNLLTNPASLRNGSSSKVSILITLPMPGSAIVYMLTIPFEHSIRLLTHCSVVVTLQ